MSAIISVTVYTADYLSGLYRCSPSATFDNAIAQVTHHASGYLSHHLVTQNRHDIAFDNGLFHCPGTVSQNDVLHIAVGMYRECLSPADLFDTVTFSRSWRLACL